LAGSVNPPGCPDRDHHHDPTRHPPHVRLGATSRRNRRGRDANQQRGGLRPLGPSRPVRARADAQRYRRARPWPSQHR